MELTSEFWKDFVKKQKQEFKTFRVANKNMWEEMAHFYKDFEKEGCYKIFKDLPVEFLLNKGVLNKNTTVADIGCGPGTHAIEFAKYSKKVFALDISEKMIDALREKMNKENIKNIDVKCADFFKENFNEKYDLVFVSMSPILNELETVDKLLEISKRYLFLIFWANKRENVVFNKAYKAIFKKEFKWDILDITIIFNYLYSLGYSPSIFYVNTKWENKYPREKIYEHILWHLKFYKDELDDNEKKIVKDIVDNSQQFETKIRVGFLFLDKLDI